jgi:flagellar biosynthesis protein FliR
MMPAGFAGVEDQLLLWLLAALRPGAAYLAAPVLSAPNVPVQLRLVIAMAIGIPALSSSGVVLPTNGFASMTGFAFVAGEILVGLALGFAVQIGFSASLLAGEAISNAMGLGFAAQASPIDGQVSPAIGQFLSMLMTFLFFVMDGHLALAGTVADSFNALPPGHAWLAPGAVRGLVHFGGLIFAAGLSVALPVGFALVLTQIVLGMVARASPALNLFAVGMPAALLVGLVLLAIALPAMTEGLFEILSVSLEHAKQIAAGA